ncbi:mitochondrial protein required for respiration [Hymenopellis radicata]|nr:mitochondrial protein required for respiration [Hymenopellis radicata]
MFPLLGPRLNCRAFTFRSTQTRGLFTKFFGRKQSVPALYKPKKERWITPTMLLVGFIPFFTFGLGTWQMRRLQWKINLIDELKEKLELPPLALPRKINLAVIPEFVWRKVAVKGRFDHSHAMLLGPRVREGLTGVNVVTPLMRADGTTILVDRGFITSDVAKSLSFSRPEAEVEVFGMIRLSQPRNTFTPDNRPEEGQWYWTDIDGMSEYAGGERANVQPVYIEEIFEGHAGEASNNISRGIPVGRAPTVNLRNSHLSYVITWYSLSALTAFMFLRLLANRKKSPVKPMPRFR